MSFLTMVAKAICDLVSGSCPLKVAMMPKRNKGKYTSERVLVGCVECLGGYLKAVFFEVAACAKGAKELEHECRNNKVSV